MEYTLEINPEKCIRCGRCVKICPSLVFEQKKKKKTLRLYNLKIALYVGIVLLFA